MRRVLINFAHPAYQKSRANRVLIESVRDLANVTINDLYENYPDFLIDVDREQDLLRKHDVIVSHHPMYWYSAPALMKEWQDLVLEFGFAYGDEGTALEGKIAFNAITTGGAYEAYTAEGYNQFTVRELLRPFEQTAALCRMTYIPPYVLHSTRKLEGKDCFIEPGSCYRKVITELRDGTTNLPEIQMREYLNDGLMMQAGLPVER